jgi:hypothetical protein
MSWRNIRVIVLMVPIGGVGTQGYLTISNFLSAISFTGRRNVLKQSYNIIYYTCIVSIKNGDISGINFRTILQQHRKIEKY